MAKTGKEIVNKADFKDQKPKSQPAKPSKEKYVLIIMHSGVKDDINSDLVRNVKRQLRTIDELPKNTEIDVWLDSPGGYADSAYKLMLALRASCSKLRIIIADYAKSSATLLALGADELYMEASAELGPLDAQMEHPDREGEGISALNITGALEHLGTTATQLVLRFGGLVTKYTSLKRKESLQAMLDFSAKFMQPITCKLDPSLIHRAQSELQVARDYGEMLLNTRRLSESQKKQADKKKDLLDDLPNKLVQNYPSHGFVIGPDEAKKLGLDIKSAYEYSMWNEVLLILDKYEANAKTITQLFKQTELLEAK